MRTCRDHFYISGTAGPIALKLGMRLAAVLTGGLHNSDGGANTHVRTCTCHFYISGTAAQIALKFGKRLGAVPIAGFHNSVGVPLRTCARARPFLYLRNGCTDYVQTWCVVRRSLAERLNQVICGDTLARAHVRTQFLYLRSALTDCIQISLWL